MSQPRPIQSPLPPIYNLNKSFVSYERNEVIKLQIQILYNPSINLCCIVRFLHCWLKNFMIGGKNYNLIFNEWLNIPASSFPKETFQVNIEFQFIAYEFSLLIKKLLSVCVSSHNNVSAPAPSPGQTQESKSWEQYVNKLIIAKLTNWPIFVWFLIEKVSSVFFFYSYSWSRSQNFIKTGAGAETKRYGSATLPRGSPIVSIISKIEEILRFTDKTSK